MTSKHKKLLHAKQQKLIVNFSRRFEPGTFTGYVLDVGLKFFLLASLNEALEFEQYTCLRVADVRTLRVPAKYAAFYTKARKLRGDKMPKRIKVDLTGASSILRSFAPSLVTIHFENVAPDSCNIGIATSDNGIDFELWQIRPDAKWEKRPTYFRLDEITRVDLPGPYERTLLLVGGPLPDLKRG
jgi:hypothetical protein